MSALRRVVYDWICDRLWRFKCVRRHWAHSTGSCFWEDEP